MLLALNTIGFWSWNPVIVSPSILELLEEMDMVVKVWKRYTRETCALFQQTLSFIALNLNIIINYRMYYESWFLGSAVFLITVKFLLRVDSNVKSETIVQESTVFKSFQRNYLIVYLIMMAADWFAFKPSNVYYTGCKVHTYTHFINTMDTICKKLGYCLLSDLLLHLCLVHLLGQWQIDMDAKICASCLD